MFEYTNYINVINLGYITLEVTTKEKFQLQVVETHFNHKDKKVENKINYKNTSIMLMSKSDEGYGHLVLRLRCCLGRLNLVSRVPTCHAQLHFPIQLPTDANLRRQQVMAQALRSLLSMQETQTVTYCLSSTCWLQPGCLCCCRHMGNKSAAGRFVSIPVSLLFKSNTNRSRIYFINCKILKSQQKNASCLHYII